MPYAYSVDRSIFEKSVIIEYFAILGSAGNAAPAFVANQIGGFRSHGAHGRGLTA
jgi:hypothetical protein